MESHQPQEEDLPRIIEFLSARLRAEETWTMDKEYPFAFNKNNIKNIHIITDPENPNIIISHAVIKELLIKTVMGIFRVAAIGSVVTHENYRNKGYSQKLVNNCLEASLKKGCDFAILWTDLYDFYHKMGFELAGSELSVALNQPINASTKGLRFMQTNNVDPQALLNVFSKHTVNTMRNAHEIKTFLSIPNTKLYSAWDVNNKLKAYAIEGRGADLTGYIHEWGGCVSHLIPLFDQIRKIKDEPITVIMPGHSKNLLHQLSHYNIQVKEGFLGMIKPLDTKNLFFKIHRHARTLGIYDLVLEKKDKTYYIGKAECLFKTESLADITRLIFGPYKASEIHKFDPEVAMMLEQVLPIPMWIWGWDSV